MKNISTQNEMLTGRQFLNNIAMLPCEQYEVAMHCGHFRCMSMIVSRSAIVINTH